MGKRLGCNSRKQRDKFGGSTIALTFLLGMRIPVASPLLLLLLSLLRLLLPSFAIALCVMQSISRRLRPLPLLSSFCICATNVSIRVLAPPGASNSSPSSDLLVDRLFLLVHQLRQNRLAKHNPPTTIFISRRLSVHELNKEIPRTTQPFVCLDLQPCIIIM